MVDPASLTLPALLSHALVAFTIEFDNEFEHRMPHRTTRHGWTGGGPWLVSLAMWSNCMRYVGADGVRVGELAELARTGTNLNGMQRWGYITIAPDPADHRPKPPRSAGIVRATARGRRAQAVWQHLTSEIESRWEARFGADEIIRLRASLAALAAQMDPGLPNCLPILGYGLFNRLPDSERPAPVTPPSRLPALLARVLLTFALEFESLSELSLALCANLLRVLDENGTPVRDLPLRSGVSKEAIAMALGFLDKKGMVEVVSDPAGSRAKLARPTPKGRQAQDAYRKLLGVIEAGWRQRFGTEAIDTLRESLALIAGAPIPEPYPDGWRAERPKPDTLPHYPMVLHRGGFPDGS